MPKAKKTKKRGTQTTVNIVIPVHIFTENGTQLDLGEFEDEILNSESELEEIIAEAGRNAGHWEGAGPVVGAIYIDQVSGIDRVIEEMRRKIKAKMKALDKEEPRCHFCKEPMNRGTRCRGCGAL